MRGAGLPRHALQLRKSDDLFVAAARTALADVTDDEVKAIVSRLIETTEPKSPAHRALPDALLELERWKLAKGMTRAYSALTSPAKEK